MTKNLTGGNYWGKKSQPGVASCINEYFGRNFGKYFTGGVQNHIQETINNDNEFIKRFLFNSY